MKTFLFDNSAFQYIWQITAERLSTTINFHLFVLKSPTCTYSEKRLLH